MISIWNGKVMAIYEVIYITNVTWSTANLYFLGSKTYEERNAVSVYAISTSSPGSTREGSCIHYYSQEYQHSFKFLSMS